MGYFSPEPKRRREDFFDMERELEALDRGVRGGKLVLVTGLRRYGKTSLILTYLSEAPFESVFIDCRLLPEGMISLSSFLSLLAGELERKSWGRRILSGVEEVGVGGFRVRLGGRGEQTLLGILHRLEGKVLVLDEAQELRRSGYRFDSLLAYIYDHLDVKVVVSGSKVGLLYRFLRLNDAEAPLYGRPYVEVKLGRLPADRAREFLRKGFEQEGVEVPEELVEEAVRRFDGVIGWLTYFGYATVTGGEPIDRILDRAAQLALSELEHALKIYGPGERRYREILRVVAALGEARWSEVRRGVEARLGRIPSNTLAAMLGNLVDSGFLEKGVGGYRIADPVLEHGIRRFW
ncbi:MAG: ATP-binding protein [Thermofilum sp.]